jgi:hypothetical protein
MTRNRWQIPYKSQTPEYNHCVYLCKRAGGKLWPDLTEKEKAPRLKRCIDKAGNNQLPISCEKVLESLESGKAKTHADIVRDTGLAPRTIRYATVKLKEQHAIREKFNFSDARQVLYQIIPQEGVKQEATV